jgi:hypothetical protein
MPSNWKPRNSRETVGAPLKREDRTVLTPPPAKHGHPDVEELLAQLNLRANGGCVTVNRKGRSRPRHTTVRREVVCGEAESWVPRVHDLGFARHARRTRLFQHFFVQNSGSGGAWPHTHGRKRPTKIGVGSKPSFRRPSFHAPPACKSSRPDLAYLQINRKRGNWVEPKSGVRRNGTESAS